MDVISTVLKKSLKQLTCSSTIKKNKVKDDLMSLPWSNIDLLFRASGKKKSFFPPGGPFYKTLHIN